jgi:hypothetical protein
MTTPDANGWLPIETAPKDGTLVLLFSPKGSQRVVCTGEFSRDWNTWMAVPGGWPRVPTHWQSLPKRPVSP